MMNRYTPPTPTCIHEALADEVMRDVSKDLVRDGHIPEEGIGGPRLRILLCHILAKVSEMIKQGEIR